MGYTYAEETMAVNYACSGSGVLSINTAGSTQITRISMPLLGVVSTPRVTPSAPEVKRHALMQQFVMRGGFFSGDSVKKGLFLAGHMCKHVNAAKG